MTKSLSQQWIDLGYMAKQVVPCPEWLDVPDVEEVCSVCNCISEDFCDFTEHWQHNGFWFFNSAEQIRQIAAKEQVDLSAMPLFFYRGYPEQYHAEWNAWKSYSADAAFITSVEAPEFSTVLGYDIVTFSMGIAPEHSPLSCNHLAGEMKVNRHCLVDVLDDAIDHVQRGAFLNAEPGPLRIVLVERVSWDRLA